MDQKQQVFRHLEDGILTITVDNPETKNGLDWAGIEQLADCYEEIDRNDAIRLGILTGNDRYFFTGGRVDPCNPGENERYTNALTRYLQAAGRVRKPMIAAVNGHCMKAGMGALALCDLAVAREGVQFSFPEVRMGGVPMMVLVEIVDSMPRKRALEALLTSWEFSAQEALQMGLVNRVVPEGEFWPTVRQFAGQLLSTPPWLVEMTRRAYTEMRQIPEREQRVAYADRMLRGEVLTRMARHETIYNV